MARTASLRSLREQVLRRADMVHSKFVTLLEVNEYINGSYAELYKMLCQSGSDYALLSDDVAVTSAARVADLPDDFMQLRGVDVDFGDGPYDAMPYVFAERNTYPTTAWPGNFTATIWYYPNPPRLNGETDEVDGVGGWEEYVVLGAAIKCLEKEESDVVTLAAMQQQKRTEILGSVASRDAGHPERVTDVHATNSPIGTYRRGTVKYRLHGASQIRFIAYTGGGW